VEKGLIDGEEWRGEEAMREDERMKRTRGQGLLSSSIASYLRDNKLTERDALLSSVSPSFAILSFGTEGDVATIVCVSSVSTFGSATEAIVETDPRPIVSLFGLSP
jgi:hypothetical protein